MNQFEKVCKGLECCVLRDPDDHQRCGECSYNHHEISNAPCANGLKADALALIRQQAEKIHELQTKVHELQTVQTARVMTLEELEDALDTVVWVEEPEFENFADHYALIMAYSHKVGFVRVSFGFAEMPVDCEYEYEDYGKKWRCWTSRPTDEQRKAVKWE